MRAFIIATIAILLAGHAARADEDVWMIGWGTLTCAGFEELHSENPQEVEYGVTDWSLGLLSGLNLASRSYGSNPGQDLTGIDANIFSVVSEGCATRADDFVADVLVTFYTQLPALEEPDAAE